MGDHIITGSYFSVSRRFLSFRIDQLYDMTLLDVQRKNCLSGIQVGFNLRRIAKQRVDSVSAVLFDLER